MRREAAGLNPYGEAVLEAAFVHMYNAVVVTDADFSGGGHPVGRSAQRVDRRTRRGATRPDIDGRL